MKPVVRYLEAKRVQVGMPVLLWPIDHGNHVSGQQVSNTTWVKTSRVVAHSPATGEIETLHTRYLPLETADERVAFEQDLLASVAQMQASRRKATKEG